MTIVKRRIFFNYEKEEKWINKMAQEGLHLVKYSLTKYTFEEGEAGAYQYRIQYLGDQSEEENEEYFQILKDGGIEVVAFDMNWAIFRKKSEEGSFDIFSDASSKIRHYHSISKMLGILAIVNLFLGFLNFSFDTTLNIAVSLLSFTVTIIILIMISYYLRRAKKLSDQRASLD